MALEIANGLFRHRSEQAIDLVVLRLETMVLQPLLRVQNPLAAVELLESRVIAGWFVVILTHATIKGFRACHADRTFGQPTVHHAFIAAIGPSS